jgi:Protein of unknown function (DUF2510)/HIRAN domain
MSFMPFWGEKHKPPPAQWFIDPADPSRLRWWDGRAWTEHYAPLPGQAVSPVVAAPSPVAAAPAVATRAAPVPGDEEPSDTLRRVQSQMVPADIDLPLDEQIEVVGEQFHAKEIRKLFREGGLAVTSAGNSLEDEVCYLVPEPWNPHDPNAVAVMVRTYQVGHLPAEIAKRYQPRLIWYAQRRQLVTGVARVWSRLESGALVRARATIAVPESTVLLADDAFAVAVIGHHCLLAMRAWNRSGRLYVAGSATLVRHAATLASSTAARATSRAAPSRSRAAPARGGSLGKAAYPQHSYPPN